MKKYLSLLAIVCLVLSMGLVSQVLANAPIYPEVPSVKLYTNNVGLTPAFDLAQFNTAPDGFGGDTAASYAVTVNFLGNASLSASAFSGAASDVNQGGYSSATDGSNTFTMTNAGGATPVSNKAKYSTYILKQLPNVGLNVGESVTIPLSSSNATGPAAAPSFGNPNALISGDPAVVSAVWANSNTAVTVTLNVATTAPVWVDVIASPVASGAIGIDQDKEKISVYTNLLQHGTFALAADTVTWGLQAAPGRTNMAGNAILSADSDSANVVATNVWQFTFADANGGIKATQTPTSGCYVPFTVGQWYTSRMLIAAKAANTDQALLFSFSTGAGLGYTSDISADVFANGIPTTWTWMEAPMYVHASQTGYPQFQLKATAAGAVDIAEVQVIQAAPELLGERGNIRDFYVGGLFTSAANTTNTWGPQVYTNSAQEPAFTLTDDALIGSSLSANFNGAAQGAGLYYGFKWTAATSGGSNLVTPAVTVGGQYGATMEMNIVSGLSGGSELSQALIVAYNVPTNGAASPLDKIEAAAEVGLMVSGTLQTVGTAIDGFAQLQFGIRGDANGTVDISNVDLLRPDANAVNFGDETLFP